MADEENNKIYHDINEDSCPTEIESLCMNCEMNGVTRLLLTSIPHFREVILMSFECPHCGLKNNEIQSGGIIAEKGSTKKCIVSKNTDLNRQVVKSEHATIKIPSLEFEIPPSTQKGVLNTIEGFIRKAKDDLEHNQEQRKVENEMVWRKIEEIIGGLNNCLTLKNEFEFLIDDPAGNSYIENLCLPNSDPQLSETFYDRSLEQNKAMGLIADMADEVFVFPSSCSSCGVPCDTRMKMVDIPYFKEVVIMSTVCDFCGYRNNEVKAGGAVSPKGRKISLKVIESDDLSRDVLKSESCGLSIPEIELDLEPGTLGGRFTTVEGLLNIIHDELKANMSFASGDSALVEKKKKMEDFLSKLRDAMELKLKFTLILDDPLGNSYVQNLCAPDPDSQLEILEYERTFEQNEKFGLNDIQTENY